LLSASALWLRLWCFSPYSYFDGTKRTLTETAVCFQAASEALHAEAAPGDVPLARGDDRAAGNTQRLAGPRRFRQPLPRLAPSVMQHIVDAYDRPSMDFRNKAESQDNVDVRRAFNEACREDLRV
jgi:hypothetical protein